MKREKVIRLNRWTADVKNSNEKRIKKILKEELPKYGVIKWNEELFKNFYINLLNNLPSRYKQKNSIEISGRLSENLLKDAIIEKLEELKNL